MDAFSSQGMFREEGMLVYNSVHICYSLKELRACLDYIVIIIQHSMKYWTILSSLENNLVVVLFWASLFPYDLVVLLFCYNYVCLFN